MDLHFGPPFRGCPGVDGCFLLAQRGTVAIDPMAPDACPHQHDAPRVPDYIGLCWFRLYQTEVAAGRTPVISGDTTRIGAIVAQHENEAGDV